MLIHTFVYILLNLPISDYILWEPKFPMTLNNVCTAMEPKHISAYSKKYLLNTSS